MITALALFAPPALALVVLALALCKAASMPVPQPPDIFTEEV